MNVLRNPSSASVTASVLARQLNNPRETFLARETFLGSAELCSNKVDLRQTPNL